MAPPVIGQTEDTGGEQQPGAGEHEADVGSTAVGVGPRGNTPRARIGSHGTHPESVNGLL